MTIVLEGQYRTIFYNVLSAFADTFTDTFFSKIKAQREM